MWLTSMVMWSNFMRLIPANGVPLSAVEANGRITNFGGLQRWGYIRVEPADQTVHPEPGGRRAQEVWRPLADEIESGGVSGSATPRSTSFARGFRTSPTLGCRRTYRCSDTPMACVPVMSVPLPARWPRTSRPCSRSRYSRSLSNTRTSPISRWRSALT